MNRSFWFGVSFFLGVSFLAVGVLWTMLAQAQISDNPDTEVCVNSVALAFYYHSETDLEKLQSGIWGIISDPELDDAQTLAYLKVFHTVQQVAHNVRKNPESDTEEFWINVLNRALTECEYLLNQQRFPDE